MYCKVCGTQNADDARFCGECGSPVTQEDTFDSIKTQENRNEHPETRRQVSFQPGRDPFQGQEQRAYQSWEPGEAGYGKDERIEVYGERLGEEPRRNSPKSFSGPNVTMIMASLVTVLLLIAVAVGGFLLISRQNQGDEEDQELEALLEDDTDSAADEQEEAAEITTTPEATEVPETTAQVTPEPTTPPVTVTPEATAPPVTVTPEVTAVPATPAVEMISLPYGLSAPASDFMFPYSSQSYLSYDQLSIMEASSIEEMHLYSQRAINEMLARYGFTFNPSRSDTAADIYNRVAGTSWYQQAQPQCPYSDANTMIANMNSYEKANIDLINEWQKQHGCYY